jgi:hypothetical protein
VLSLIWELQEKKPNIKNKNKNKNKTTRNPKRYLREMQWPPDPSQMAGKNKKLLEGKKKIKRQKKKKKKKLAKPPNLNSDRKGLVASTNGNLLHSRIGMLVWVWCVFSFLFLFFFFFSLFFLSCCV